MFLKKYFFFQKIINILVGQGDFSLPSFIREVYSPVNYCRNVVKDLKGLRTKNMKKARVSKVVLIVLPMH